VSFDWAQLHQMSSGDEVFKLSTEEFAKAGRAYESLIGLLNSSKQEVYGLHTHYGFNVKDKVKPGGWRDHQLQLLKYLSVGTGPAIDPKVVRLALRLQAKKIGKGRSGVHPETLESLINLSNEKDLPVVPCQGSLGASGDLIPMAHAVAPIFVNHGVKGPRDVIGLVNTNSMMSAQAWLNWSDLQALIDRSIESMALLFAAIGCSTDFLSESLLLEFHSSDHCLRFARRVKEHALELSSFESHQHLQHPYSIRCSPQVMGMILFQMEHAKNVIQSEANAIADNPILSDEQDRPLHGGLFYANGVAWAADQMQDAAGRLAEILDRQILLLMDPAFNGELNNNLLSVEDGLHAKGLHQLLSSLNQEMRAKSQPSRLMSFSCESNNQDLVPCGMMAQKVLRENIQTLTDVVRGAHFCAKRAYHLRNQIPLGEELDIKNFESY